MAKNAEFKIIINGLTESINAVDALNKQLDALEKRLDTLGKKSVSVSASGGGNRAALDEEAKMLQQIEQLHQKVAASEKAEYQELLHAKEELKEYQQIAKSIAAQTNLDQGINNTNTMAGMKAQLKDLKTAMQTLDVESDKFKQLQQDANELNAKLLEIEKGYGQFGRNVGNYANGVAEGMQKVVIKVGETERTFESAREASRTLNNELKSMAVNGQQGTKEYNELNDAVKQLNSTLKDVEKSSVAMDNLLDTMQGLTALASVGQGLSALFGLDDSAIEKSIQKLVALQNVLQGIETINKQIQAQEGIGSWLSKGNAAIDKFAAGLLKAEKNAKLLASGLKLLGGAAIVAGITALVVLFNKFQKEQEEARKAFERNLDVIKTGAEAYKRAEIELNGYIKKLDEFKGSKKAEKQLIEEVSKKYDIHNKNIKDVKDMKALLIKMAPTYLETIKEEAKMTALAAESAKLYADNIALIAKRDKLQTDYNNLNWNERLSGYGAALKKQLNDINTEIDANAKSMDVFNKELDKSADIVAKNKKALSEMGVGGGREKNIKENSKKIEDAVRQAEQGIINARVSAMKDGLVKTLTQLQIERNRRIEEAKKTGRMVAEQVAAINREFDKKERDARIKYHKERIEDEKRYQDELLAIQRDTNEKMYENSRLVNERTLKETQDKYNYEFEGEGGRDNTVNTLTYNYDTNFDLKLIGKWKQLVREIVLAKTNIKLFNDEQSKTINGLTKDETIKKLEKLEKEFSKMIQANPSLPLESENVISETMSGAFEQRLNLRYYYYQKLTEATENYYAKELEITKEALKEETQDILDEEEKRHNALVKIFDVADSVPQNQLKDFMSYMSSGSLKGFDDTQIGKFFEKYREQLNKWIDSLENKLDEGKLSIEKYVEITGSTLYQSYIKTKDDYDEFLKLYNEMPNAEKKKRIGELEEWTNKMNAAWLDYMRKVEQENETHQNRMKVITSNGNEQINKIENELLEERKRNIASFYSSMTAEYERALSSVANRVSKQPKSNILGIFNYKQERKNLKDLQKATADVMVRIAADKEGLIDNLKHQEISFEDFDAAMDNLNALSNQAEDTAAQLSEKIKELPGEWWKSIDQWLQIVGQAATSIIQSIGEINDAAFEKQLEAIERQTKALEEQLDKQRELTQKYADDVNDIEDELSSSRGDRRQYLIDMLNQQMAAERESLAQEKQIEKEQERLDKKKKQLDYENEMRKWNQSKATAAINAALAISNAAVNNWPIPAIPMMALATTVGAAQMAAVLAQKPKKYADGGRLEGKSHSQGGIKVLGGQAEVEGGEYVTNKRTTAQNLALLQFINKKKRKIDLSDMVDFYMNGANKNISNARKTYLADGGQLPMLRNDINISGKLVTTMEQYANRDVVVQVVDIINKADNLKNTQVLAGLAPKTL